VEGAPHYEHGADVANGASGVPCLVRGSVRGLDGQPVVGALIDVWQADADGKYDVQRTDLPEAQGRGVLRSGDDGRFHFQSVVAEPYPIPDDGPVGRLLRATGRHSNRPAHIHFIVRAAGHVPLTTHLFVAGSPYLDSDAVFGVKDSLVVEFKTVDDPTLDAAYRMPTPFRHADVEIRLRTDS
jgi:protocatechuate 3,4-dioxygenase beta subunit